MPSQPRIILWHHAITFLLLQIPLHHPQLGRYTCMVRSTEGRAGRRAGGQAGGWFVYRASTAATAASGPLAVSATCQRPTDHPPAALCSSINACLLQDGLIEWNTFFLVARRQFPSRFRLFNRLYWGTFYPMRLVLFPVLLPLFWQEMQVGAGGRALVGVWCELWCWAARCDAALG